MAIDKPSPGVSEKDAKREPEFAIDGRIQLEGMELISSEVKLTAYAFDEQGRLLGDDRVNAKGRFEVELNIQAPKAVELFIGPYVAPEQMRKSAAYHQRFGEGDWVDAGAGARLRPTLFVTRPIWSNWWPKSICVSGHVFKETAASNPACPVPFVKVEIFDVDRDRCLWPHLYSQLPSLLDRRVIDLGDLELEEPPRPIPEPPGPAPLPPIKFPPGAPEQEEVMGFASHPLSEACRMVESWNKMNPQPEPPDKLLLARSQGALGPQPEPPDMPAMAMNTISIGEVASLDPGISSRLSTLTLESTIAPWHLRPRCFYSKQLICETETDEHGYFRCCFRWWPLEIRRGRLRFDHLPDLIFRVTQTVDGVEQVIYLDPYTSTRWNVGSTHVDLYLDHAEVNCGSGDVQERPSGTQVFFTRIGHDEVYLIDQTTGLAGKAPWTTWSRAAYGNYNSRPYWLRLFGQFGDTLSSHAAVTGATPPYYYKLSYSRNGSDFTPVSAPLADTRVAKSTMMSESYALGPVPVGGEPALYQVRNFDDYFWYNPDLIGLWNTRPVEADTGSYILRLEIFDSTGTRLDSSLIDYRDGTREPPGVLPVMTDSCDLKVTVDNKRPVISMTVTPDPGVCGVIPWELVPPLDIAVAASHENGRLRAWNLVYGKGTTAGSTSLAGGSSSNGTLGSVSQTVNANSMLTGVTSTCAFWVRLWAAPNIRDGYRWVHGAQDTDAIVIERCTPAIKPAIEAAVKQA